MSSLTEIEKRYLEKLLDMSGGYVLDFTDATFGDFFECHNVDIHGCKYLTLGTSKAKKLRAFWASESDRRVGAVLADMLDYYEAACKMDGGASDKVVLKEARSIVGRLLGRPADFGSTATEGEFLAREFATPSITKMPIDSQVVPIIEDRLTEARVALGAGAHLSVIFLCGSVLEAVLLGAAQQSPVRFNKAAATPKRDGSPKQFHDWRLAQLIDVACEVGVLKPDIGTFSHGFRDFRNYIHRYQQMQSGFTPDEHTAKLCFQVLKAALASLAGERP